MAQQIPSQGYNAGNLEILSKHRENTWNFVYSSCKFPGSRGKEFCDICAKILTSFRRLIYSFVFIIVTNHVNWHRTNLWLDGGGGGGGAHGKHREYEIAI